MMSDVFTKRWNEDIRNIRADLMRMNFKYAYPDASEEEIEEKVKQYMEEFKKEQEELEKKLEDMNAKGTT